MVELLYIGMPVVQTVGQAGGRAYGHVITKISRWVDYQFSYPWCCAARAWGAWSSAVTSDKTLPSRSQGLGFFIYVSEEERKRLETRLKILCLSFHCTGPYTAWHVFVYSHILSLCSLCLPVNGCCMKYHFAPFLLFYFVCFLPVINLSVLSFVKTWKKNLGHVQARALV